VTVGVLVKRHFDKKKNAAASHADIDAANSPQANVDSEAGFSEPRQDFNDTSWGGPVSNRQYTDNELQGAADSIQELNNRGESVITVTQTQDGRVVVSSNNQIPTPDQRAEAQRIFGDDVEIVGGTTRTNADGATGNHSEQRGIQYLGDDANGARQASSHNSCDGCANAQDEAGVINVTGTAADNGGIITRPLDLSLAPDHTD